MSLANPDDEYDEILPRGRGGTGKTAAVLKKYLIVLVIGIVIGAGLQFFFINDLVGDATKSTCSSCFISKDLLSKENECLYTLIPNPQAASAQCGASAFIAQQKTVQKDFNEETG